MSTFHLSVDRVDEKIFICEANRLLNRSFGYLALALVKGEETRYWVERTQDDKINDQREHPQNPKFSRLFDLTLSSLKYLSQTLPKRDHNDEAITLSLSFQMPKDREKLVSNRSHSYPDQNVDSLDGGRVYAHGFGEGLLLLFTQEKVCSEQARFWLKNTRSRLT